MGIVILRTTLVYALVVLAVRLMGKRQVGELQPSELVTTILISNLASLSVEDSIHYSCFYHCRLRGRPLFV